VTAGVTWGSPQGKKGNRQLAWGKKTAKGGSPFLCQKGGTVPMTVEKYLSCVPGEWLESTKLPGAEEGGENIRARSMAPIIKSKRGAQSRER